ncbi:MAG: hypothetical protein KH366_07580 [Clostridiaceae bacterium]|nr:hypothetical protein [Clostridiaceae bacterium]
MKEFPFPDKENSMNDLRQDYVFPKIEKERVDEIFMDAWNVGETQARLFLETHRNDKKLDMLDILQKSGVTVVYKEMDYVLGKRRYFCEYLSGKNLLKVYTDSVALWCENNGFSYEEGLNVILCHEYFHYLECHKIGMTSRRYQVPILKIGPVKLGKTGVPSLSEIGANAFAGVCYKYLVEEERS